MNMQKIPINGHAVLFEYSEFARYIEPPVRIHVYEYLYHFTREAQQTPREQEKFCKSRHD
jgi:hypothetical protein